MSFILANLCNKQSACVYVPQRPATVGTNQSFVTIFLEPTEDDRDYITQI